MPDSELSVQKNPPPTLLNLPDEILLKILADLSDSDLWSVLRTNATLRRLAFFHLEKRESVFLWKKLLPPGMHSLLKQIPFFLGKEALAMQKIGTLKILHELLSTPSEANSRFTLAFERTALLTLLKSAQPNGANNSSIKLISQTGSYVLSFLPHSVHSYLKNSLSMQVIIHQLNALAHSVFVTPSPSPNESRVISLLLEWAHLLLNAPHKKANADRLKWAVNLLEALASIKKETIQQAVLFGKGNAIQYLTPLLHLYFDAFPEEKQFYLFLQFAPHLTFSFVKRFAARFIPKKDIPENNTPQNTQAWREYEAASTLPALILATKKARLITLFQDQTDSIYLPAIENISHAANLDLFAAIEAGDLQRALALIGQGINVNTKDEKDQTPLMRAAIGGHFEIVLALIVSGANLNAQNTRHDTALLYAALNSPETISENNVERTSENNAERIVGALIQAGANPDSLDRNRNTALLLTLKNNATKSAKKLIPVTTNLNAKNTEGDTALLIAIENDNDEIALLLIQAGADLNIKSKHGHPPLIKAIIHKRIKVARALLEAGADPNILTLSQSSPLLCAAQEGLDELVALLIKAGANIHHINKRRENALTLASKGKHTETIYLLLAAGASIDDLTEFKLHRNLKPVSPFLQIIRELDQLAFFRLTPSFLARYPKLPFNERMVIIERLLHSFYHQAVLPAFDFSEHCLLRTLKLILFFDTKVHEAGPFFLSWIFQDRSSYEAVQEDELLNTQFFFYAEHLNNQNIEAIELSLLLGIIRICHEASPETQAHLKLLLSYPALQTGFKVYFESKLEILIAHPDFNISLLALSAVFSILFPLDSYHAHFQHPDHAGALSIRFSDTLASSPAPTATQARSAPRVSFRF